MKQQDPGLEQRMQQIQQQAQQWLQQHTSDFRSLITIPIVVHVVYNNSLQNISDQQIQSQIDVLNEDYRHRNLDTFETPNEFKPLAADCMIQFCLAAFDPNGNATNGITRTQTNKTSFSLGDSMKFNAKGGEDGWPSDQYLNIWTCNLDGPILGFTTLPGGFAADDGVVVLYKAFGRVGTLISPYNKGRTCTHEIGHWLGLYHPWGDDGGGCSGTDYIADTPNEDDATYGCPGFPLLDACSPAAPGVMFMNYMDYTDDGCMDMFTNDQRDEMISVLNTTRSSILSSSAGCNVASLDAAISYVIEPVDGGTESSLSFQPKILLSNHGTDEITYVKIEYTVDGQPYQYFDFTGSLLSTTSSDTITLPIIFTGEGGHVFHINCSNPNHSNDQNHSNDTVNLNFNVESSVAVNTLNVYPNPLSDVYYLQIINPSAADLELDVCNTLGQVMRKSYFTLSTTNVVKDDMSGLDEGVYFLYAHIGYDRVTLPIVILR